MRELTFNEISFVAGGPTSAPPPTCPGGSTLTSTTYNANGSVNTYTCTPNGQLQQQDSASDLAAAAAAVGTFIIAAVAFVLAS
jgi:hypothetical protein